ncbi:hypothetical protein Tco_1188041 [Tanacetum coccineum]
MRACVERIITASGSGFSDWQWRLSTLPFAFGGLGVYSADDVLNYAFLASRLQYASLQSKLLRHSNIVTSGPAFDNALSAFNAKMEIDLLSNPRLTGVCYAIGWVLPYSLLRSCAQLALGSLRGIFMETMMYRAGIVGIKHRHNNVRDTLVDVFFQFVISAGKGVNIGLGRGRDKPLRLADMLLYSWDRGLNVGSSPLTQTGMINFAPGWAVIEAA